MNAKNKKNILIIDDDIETSIKYKKWLEEEEKKYRWKFQYNFDK
jgi:hypothetical protein